MKHRNHICLVIGPPDPRKMRSVAEALYSAGMLVQRLTTCTTSVHPGTAEIIMRADAEGGVPIVLYEENARAGVQFLCDLMDSETLPGRPYLLITEHPDKALEALWADAPDHDGRVLVVGTEELGDQTSQKTLNLFLDRDCLAYLPRKSKARVAPAPVTDMPVGERPIHDIDRRVMQRGMFKVAALKVPRF